MNVLQNFIDFEDYDICNKIYAYLGTHSIVLNTDLKNKMKNALIVIKIIMKILIVLKILIILLHVIILILFYVMIII